MGIPDYIREEIEKYWDEKKRGIDRHTTYDNIMAFIRLAVVNERITEKEAEKIREQLQFFLCP